MLAFLEENTNLFSVDGDGYVNPVNCQGAMGKGLAVQFKIRFPTMYKGYIGVCKRKNLKPGTVWTWRDSTVTILNAATKDEWRNPSTYGWIKSCLQQIVEESKKYSLQRVVVPALGCGNGGLSWEYVEAMMMDILSVGDTVFLCIKPHN